MSEKIKVTTGASGKLKIKTAKTAKPKSMSAKVAKSSAIKPAKTVAPKLATASGTNTKETLYIDVDDDITTIIDKIQRTKGNILALVLPKRATALQSVVNMKLLKRTAGSTGKNLVLVTGEASLLPLAGLVGLHVAETPSSKPTIPPAPDRPSDEPESVDESIAITGDSGIGVDAEEFDAESAADTPIGELAGVSHMTDDDQVDEVMLGDDPGDEDDAPEAARPDVALAKKNKKLAVPSFSVFRTRLILGVLLFIFVMGGWFVATRVLPKATISIQTNSQVVKSNLNVTLDTSAKTVDTENKIIPASAQNTTKTYSQQAAATGQQNNGTKASGTVKLAVCIGAPPAPADIPAGSTVTANGRTYITQETATFSYVAGGGSCFKFSTDNTDIKALKAGAEYNTGASTTFTTVSGVSGTGSASGGTDNIVKVVAQGDIDSAKTKISSQDTALIRQNLQSGLQSKGLMPVSSTFIAGDPQVTTSASVGDQVDTVTVSATVAYSMLGIKQTDLQTLVVANVKSQIDTKKQKILDDGVAKAIFSQQSQGSPTSAVVNISIQSIAGPELNIDTIKQQVAGKKSGDIEKQLGGLPGVTSIKVNLSPFWVSSVPTDTSKITVDIAKPSGA